jgi:hypothetical protein
VITSKDLACNHLDQIILKIKWKNKGLDNAIVHLPWVSYQVAFCYSTNKNIRSLWVSTATSICHNLQNLANAIVHLPWVSYQVAFCYSTNKNIRSLWVSTATSICHNLQNLANNVKARQSSLQRLISICQPFLLNNR